MIKKVLLILATALLSVFIWPVSANASVTGGSVRHASPDSDYDKPIIVQCDDGVTRTVSEGDHSDDICSDEDVDKVYVRYDEEIWCEGSKQQFYKAFDSRGWHNYHNWQNLRCVVKRD